MSRFLAIESCGQCSPCTQDGLALAGLLETLSRSKATDRDIELIAKKVATVADGARCSLARQQQAIVGGLLARSRAAVAANVSGVAAGRRPEFVAELTGIVVTIDELHGLKQPDWSYATSWSGETPVERFIDHRQRDDGKGLKVDAAALAVLSRLADAVIVADADGMITEWNAAAETLLGWTRTEAVNASLDLIIPERLRRRHWDGYSRVMKTGHTVHAGELLEVPALHRSGDIVSVAFTVTVVEEHPGGPYEIVAVLRDDTERRRLHCDAAGKS